MPEFNPQLDPATGWWVTGLTDGEGCFFAGLNFRERETSSGRRVQCVELEAQFTIALRADDKRTLDQIKHYFGCGAVNYKRSSKNSPSAQRAGLVDPKPQYRFIIRKPADLFRVVIPHFELYPLRSKKGSDFETWAKIVTFAVGELVGRKGWLRCYPDKVEQLGSMCSVLKESRKFVPQLVVGG